jgi:hypothetical protein
MKSQTAKGERERERELHDNLFIWKKQIIHIDPYMQLYEKKRKKNVNNANQSFFFLGSRNIIIYKIQSQRKYGVAQLWNHIFSFSLFSLLYLGCRPFPTKLRPLELCITRQLEPKNPNQQDKIKPKTRTEVNSQPLLAS